MININKCVCINTVPDASKCPIGLRNFFNHMINMRELLKPGTRDPGGILKPGTSKIWDCRYFILKPGTLISGTSFCTAGTFR